MKNRIKTLFKNKQSEILNIFFTAGYPFLESTKEIALSLDKANVDIIEIGMPYSDPLADGETIQLSSQKALENGMTLEILFKQMKEIRSESQIPIVLMGYYNQLLQFGIEAFLSQCEESGVDGLIIPDLPLAVYNSQMKELAQKSNLAFSFLICPRTSAERMQSIDDASNGFIYVVASSSITGTTISADDASRKAYFEKIKEQDFKNPTLIGFGIHDKQSFDLVSKYANGAIIGSAFIRALNQNPDQIQKTVKQFIGSIKS